MIIRNPNLPDYFLCLEQQKTFGDYARAYGDKLAECYERNGIIFVPFMPITFDFDFFQSITMPPQLKKIGTADGIEHLVLQRDEQQLTLNQQHPFMQIFKNTEIALYLQSQIALFNSQLRNSLSILFPRYYSLAQSNITWRLTETKKEGMHFDIYQQGAPRSQANKQHHRLKMFINIDTQPRHWRTTYALPDVIKYCRDQLPKALPDDVNVLNDTIDRLGILKDLPYHEIQFPSMSAVIANGETVAHEVVYGRRTVAVEFFCDYHDMLEPARHSHTALKHWITDNGYSIAPDINAVRQAHAHLKGSYEVLREKEAQAKSS